MSTASASPPPPPSSSPSPSPSSSSRPRPAVDALKALLNQTLRISCSDGRVFVGTFVCVDKQLHVVLANTDEYSANKPEGRYVAMVMVPWQLVVAVAVHDDGELDFGTNLFFHIIDGHQNTSTLKGPLLRRVVSTTLSTSPALAITTSSTSATLANLMDIKPCTYYLTRVREVSTDPHFKGLFSDLALRVIGGGRGRDRYQPSQLPPQPAGLLSRPERHLQRSGRRDITFQNGRFGEKGALRVRGGLNYG